MSLPFLTHAIEIASSLPDTILSFRSQNCNVGLPTYVLCLKATNKADLLIQDEFTSA